MNIVNLPPPNPSPLSPKQISPPTSTPNAVNILAEQPINTLEPSEENINVSSSSSSSSPQPQPHPIAPMDTLYFDTVVQIYTFVPEFNPMAPFQTAGTREGRGTGFFIADNIIMTAAHVVHKAFKDTGVKFTVPSIGKTPLFSTRVITFIPEIDIALLLVTSPNFPKRSVFLPLGDDRELKPGLTFEVFGYPMGDNNLKVTKSTYNGLQNGVIQIDSSINPGNSGGPVVYNNKVIGIVSSGYDPKMANSIAFAIPISVYLAVKPLDPMKITDETRVLRLPSLGIMYNNGTDTGIVYDDKTCENGVMVQWVSKKSALFPIIKEGDKLCAILVPEKNNIYNIDNVGEVQVPWYNTKIPLPHAISLLPVNTPIQVRYWSHEQKKVQTTENIILTHAFNGAFQSVYYPFEKIDYETFGGIVVMPLSSIHLMAFNNLFYKLSPSEKEQDRLIISYVFPNSKLAESQNFSGGEILKTVNGRAVHTLEEYRKALETPLVEHGKPHIEWITDEDVRINIPVDELLLQKQEQLQEQYNFPQSVVNQFYQKK